ncbi:MAG: hypothetical protein ACI4TI_01990 [Christensenellales bacterium]
MKKFSGLVLSFLMLLVVCFSGCTYADKATLLTIQEKYNYISSKNQNIFVGDEFNPMYDSEKMLLAINDSELKEFSLLKSDTDRQNFENCNVYGLLFRAINSSYLTNDVLTITNDATTRKEYKKNMYVSLENLQNHLQTLDSTKRSLESVFNNNAKSYMIVAKENTAIYNLNNYMNSLHACLDDLLDFNKAFNDAVINDIAKTPNLDSILYETIAKVDYSANNQLINSCNLLISNYILSYSANLLLDAGENEKLVSNLRELLSEQVLLKSGEVTSDIGVENYKIARVLEDSLKKEEKTFDLICSGLTKEKLNSEKPEDEFNNNFVKTYANKLLDYSNKLIEYLKSL